MKKHLNFFQRLFLPLPKLEEYYRNQRREEFSKNELIYGIKWRQKIHGIIIFILKLDSLFSGRKTTVVADKRKKTDKPIIFACTHVGRYDIETALQTISTHCYFFMGDPGKVYKSLDGLILFLNGTIFVDTAYKEDRYIVKETCIKALKQGANLLIYPEGAWNITENEIVMPLFNGTAEMAIRSGAEIVPIAIEQRGKRYYVNIGENICVSTYELSQKQELTDRLRDILSTLRWEIWEQLPPLTRTQLPTNAAKQYLDEIMSQTENGYTIDEIKRTRYHKKVSSCNEIFDHLSELAPNSKTAFLYNKRNHF